MSQSAPWRFVLEGHVVKHVVDGHHRRVSPLLRDFRMRPYRSLKVKRAPLDGFSKHVEPGSVTTRFCKLLKERSGGDHVALSDGGTHLGVDFKGEVHRLLSFQLRQVTVP